MAEDRESGMTQAGPDGPVRASRLEARVGGRPLMVYLVLLGGIATLVMLLVIVWMSATNNGNDKVPICLDMSGADAIAAIEAGEVKRVNILVDRLQPNIGPAAIQVDLIDDTCRKLPQGADNRHILLEVLGAVEYFNSTGDQRVRTNYMMEDVPANLLATSTPTPEPTGTPTNTPEPTAISTPEPTSTPSPEPTDTPRPTATPAPPTATATATVPPRATNPPTAAPTRKP